jgi:hypothetical protein
LIAFEHSEEKANEHKFFNENDKDKDVYLAPKHIGPATGTKSEIFESQIINANKPQREMEGIVLQYIDATPFKGKKIIFKAFSRFESDDQFSQGQMWLQVNINREEVHSINSLEKPILNNEWAEYQVEAEIPENAENIMLALVLIGEGKIWFDETKLEIIDKRNIVSKGEPRNYGFEDGDFGKLFVVGLYIRTLKLLVTKAQLLISFTKAVNHC